MGGGAYACDWCRDVGDAEALRSVVLQAAAGLRSSAWAAPPEVVPLHCETDTPPSREPWAHLDAPAVALWATKHLEQCEFRRYVTDADRERVPGVPGPAAPLRSRVRHPDVVDAAAR